MLQESAASRSSDLPRFMAVSPSDNDISNVNDFCGRHKMEASYPIQNNVQVKCRFISTLGGTRLWFSLVLTQAVQGLPINIDFMQPPCVIFSPPQDGIVPTTPIPKKHEPRKWRCPASGCSSSFVRIQERKRHLLSHLPLWIHCSYPSCSWKGDRLSAFRSHRNTKHPSSGQDSEKGHLILYDPFPLVKRIEEGTLSIHDARNHAMSMVKNKALELGLPGLYDNPWGRKGRRAQPSDTWMSSRSAEKEKGNVESHLEGRDDKEVEKAKVCLHSCEVSVAAASGTTRNGVIGDTVMIPTSTVEQLSHPALPLPRACSSPSAVATARHALPCSSFPFIL
jgi:hypothetical protein